MAGPVWDIEVDFAQSRGSYVVDRPSGRRFLDFFSMYASLPLGYAHPVFDDAFRATLGRVGAVKMANNVARSAELQEFLTSFLRYAPGPHIHLTCTGALAVESAIKCALEARKLASPVVYSLANAFHGINAWGVVTDRSSHSAERLRYVPRFPWQTLPLPELVDALEGRDATNVAPVVVEPILCTAGDIYHDPVLLRRLRAACVARDVCFIVDEIQTGFGATGAMWYCEKLDLAPDVLIFGKKAQVSGIVVRDRYAECVLSPHGKLGVTFDGDLLDAIRATYVLKAYEQEGLVARANRNQQVFREILAPRTLGYRGEGHLLAFDVPTRKARDELVSRCFAAGLLCNKAGERTIRLRPSLAITPDEIAHFGEIIVKALASL